VRFAAVGESESNHAARRTLIRAIVVAAATGLLLGIAATVWRYR
jgi:hypothetical protein